MHKQHLSAGSRAGCGAADDAARMSANAAGLTDLCFTPASCAAVRERRARWAGARRIQRAALMKAISGARLFRPDCPAASPQLAADGRVIPAEEIGRRGTKNKTISFFLMEDELMALRWWLVPSRWFADLRLHPRWVVKPELELKHLVILLYSCQSV